MSNLPDQTRQNYRAFQLCQSVRLFTGSMQVGRLDGQKPVQIRLSGASILEEHCIFDNMSDGKVSLTACADSVTVRCKYRITKS